jgi:hypothetical protein
VVTPSAARCEPSGRVRKAQWDLLQQCTAAPEPHKKECLLGAPLVPHIAPRRRSGEHITAMMRFGPLTS